MEASIFKIFLILGMGGLISQFLVARMRQRRSYQEHLEPILKKYNLTFISSKFPGWFKVGPFPKFEVTYGRLQSSVPFLGSGEYSQYRIVEFKDQSGKIYRVWVMLEFELFTLRDISWRIYPGDPFPAEAQTVLDMQ